MSKSEGASSGAAYDRSAGVPPAVLGASRPRYGEVTIRDRGRLPHWEKESGAYSITFRLADSLPKSVLEKIVWEREDVIRTAKHLGRNLSADEASKLQRLSNQAMEEYLDQGAGACYLREPAIAGEVANALRCFDGQRYRLFAWCIMPNHVHVVVRMLPAWTLASVVHSWKSFTAKRANQILQARGAFWQREYYDHLIRNESEFARAVSYVAENPLRAGLDNWPWVWVCGQDARTTAGETPALRKTPALREIAGVSKK